MSFSGRVTWETAAERGQGWNRGGGGGEELPSSLLLFSAVTEEEEEEKEEIFDCSVSQGEK